MSQAAAPAAKRDATQPGVTAGRSVPAGGPGCVYHRTM